MATASSAVRGFIRRRLDPNAYLGLYATIGIAVLWGMVWVFSKLLDAVLDKEPIVRVDETAAQWMNLHATPLGDRIFSAVTAFGFPVVWMIFVAVGALLWYRHRAALLIAWVVANLGGKGLVEILKSQVHRTRPIYGAEFLQGHSYSFPSAHAMSATISYMMLAFVVVHLYGLTGARRVVVYLVALVIVGAVGFSRIYLGVHYPSDVLGGFFAGGACVTACLTAYAVAHRRRRMLRDGAV